MAQQPETVICTYHVAAGKQADFEKLLQLHWPALDGLGFVTDRPVQVFRRDDEQGRTTYVEIFEWAAGGFQRAHAHPEVMAIWEPMAQICEPRDGRPAMDFPHFQPIVP